MHEYSTTARPVLATIGLAILCFLVAGCGGSSQTKTVTVGTAKSTIVNPFPPAPPPAAGFGSPPETAGQIVTVTCGWYLQHIGQIDLTDETNVRAPGTCSGESFDSSKPVVLRVAG